ncbi:FkbM family methyltransferase [Luteolibacter soli]|uniref:FkbM family methyltransferase n=1 Tax=Luteolibacter soli TaxID=3135280 RepID=A0ABU9ATW7_9BACT
MSFDRALKGPWIGHSFRSLLAGLRHDAFYSLLNRNVSGLEDLGDSANGCNWTILTTDLNADSVIYSAGVGRDISFEHALANRFSATIQLIDPSPTGQATMSLAPNQRPEFIFHPVALAGKPGFLDLGEPSNPEEGSWMSMDGTVQSNNAHQAMIQVPCVTVSDLMKQLGHRSIDLLKIDIEGAEYAVLESLLEEKVPVRQIAVEFHNGILPGIPRSLTINLLFRLFRDGYRLVYKGGNNHTLVKAS